MPTGIGQNYWQQGERPTPADKPDKTSVKVPEQSTLKYKPRKSTVKKK